MNLQEARSAFGEQQDAWKTVVLEPNTLERNLILAGHRTEMSRLQKLITKAEQMPVKTTVSPSRRRNEA